MIRGRDRTCSRPAWWWGLPRIPVSPTGRAGVFLRSCPMRHVAMVTPISPPASPTRQHRPTCLRIDHIMGLHRLYWIPDGMNLDEGTYVRYPTEENFAVLCLESHRHRCEIIGENLGTVPPEIDSALPRHGIAGMYLAQFAAGSSSPAPIRRPAATEVALIGTHDTPPLAGWVAGVDIGERVRLGLMPAAGERAERRQRAAAANRLATTVGSSADEPDDLLARLLDWLGRSSSPLVTVWLEDLWLESAPVNIPGSSSADRPNWQRPMSRTVEEIIADPSLGKKLEQLRRARQQSR